MRYSTRPALRTLVLCYAVLICASLAPCLRAQSPALSLDTDQITSEFQKRFENIDLPSGIEFQGYVRSDPRPLRIYRLTVDLTVSTLEPVVAIAADPDNEGPAETALTSPKTLARQENMVVAINTNAWSMIPDPQTGKSIGYVPGGQADVHGWVFQPQRLASPVQEGYWSFWIDADRNPHLENLTAKQAAAIPQPQIAIAGFRGILAQGKVIVEPSDVLHPRTSLGFDASGKKLTLVVVDGRQPKVSEGVSEEELARLMVEFGCSDAINLDGGGSSVMLARQKDGDLRFINRSSDRTGVRPVPVIFGFRLAP
jgi:hypothetical protein